MKKILKTLCCLLAITLLCSAVLSAGCKNEEDVSNCEVINKVDYNGVHVFNMPEMSEYVVRDGKTDYKLVIPKKLSDKVKIAKEEFQYFFEKATGININFVYDEDDSGNKLGFSAEDKYISIGETTVAAAAGISVKGLCLGNDGVRIETKGKSIFLSGGSDTGVIYAVYDFMSVEFGYEQYSYDCYDLETGVKELKLKNYDITDVPDIGIRVFSSRVVQQRHNQGYDGRMYKYRMRMPAGISEYYFPIHKGENAMGDSATFHNCTYYAPVEVYGSEHPDWFGDQSTKQLCYTAHGNEEELQSLLEHCAKKITDSLTKYTPESYPNYNALTLSMSDGESNCNCAKCSELATKYGAESGALIIFMNRLNKLVHEWMDKEENAQYKREDLQLLFFAYNGFSTAPAKYNEQEQKWEATYPEVALDKGVGVFFAQIANVDYQQGLYSEMNKSGYDNAAAWFDMSEKVYLWTYSTNFSDYYAFYDSFSFFNNDAYQWYSSKGAVYWYNQQQYNHEYALPNFHDLKLFLDSKLMWNASVPAEELIDKYFNARYKEAAPLMKQMFTEMRIHSASICLENDLYVLRSIYNDVLKTKYYPYSVLERWLKLCEQAMEKVAKYKDIDAEAYNATMNHIYAEAISPLYSILKLYKEQLSESQLMHVKELFKTAVYATNISATSEYTDDALFDMVKNV